jgi:hypothetical protein
MRKINTFFKLDFFMKHLFLCALLIGCASSPQVPNSASQPTPSPIQAPKRQPKYKVGDCLMIVDLPKGETQSRHRVRVEKISADRYYYRWLLDDGRWDSELSSNVGKFEVLEKISKKVFDCPKELS